MTERRERRSFSEEFKNQMVQLYNVDKPRAEIIREYDLSSTAFDRWTKRIRRNAHKYSISALCKCLDIAHSTYYYELHDSSADDELSRFCLLLYIELDFYST